MLALSLATALLPLGSALSFPGASVGRGYVHVPVTRRITPANTGLQRRGPASQDIGNAQNGGYMVNILDTGSIELWVDPDCSKARPVNTTSGASDSTNGVDNPDVDANFCQDIGRYDPKKSSSAKSAPGLSGSTLHYADFTTATVNYYEDTMSIAGVTINNQIFGVANASNQTATGILGIAPNPLGFNDTPEYPYSLMLSNMQKQGLIQSRAFSLDLRDFDNTTGSLIFGGVDKSRYKGALQQVPFETVDAKASDGSTYKQYAYWVKVTSMSFSAPGATSSSKSYTLPTGDSFTADLDSGTGGILLPDGLTSEICSDMNGTVRGANCFVDCSVRDQPLGGITFGFNDNNKITVSYENLIETATQKQGDGKTIEFCYLAASTTGIVSDPPTYILGAPFLRSAYAVFDWDNQNVHLAQAATCGSSSDIVAIGTGSNAVPAGDGNCSSWAARGVVLNAGLMAAAALLAVVVML